MKKGEFRRLLTLFVILLPLTLIFCGSVWAYPFPLPDTGQTKCYNNTEEITCPGSGEAFYGQDGNYLINPPSYTKLEASGNDLADSATSWVMVRDNVTGLIWEVKTDDGYIHDKDNQYTWYDSNPETNGGDAGTPGDGTDTEDFIAALNTANFGGNNDWRLPTIKELASISNLGMSRPAVDTVYFPNTVLSSYYWSSTTQADDTSSAWFVDFFDYGADGWLGKSNNYYVRAVRGGQGGSLGNLIINGDGTVTDVATGLMWQQDGTGSRITWEEAISYCEELSLLGYEDWRLPNFKELRSIVDYTKGNPAINTNCFPTTVSSYYWSSTTDTRQKSRAWHVYFKHGNDGWGGKSSLYFYVRAVRGGQARLFGHLIISAPAQGSTWNGGTVMAITWDTQGISGNVAISISREGGKDGTFETIAASTENDGSFDWTVTGTASVNCMLKIEPLSDPSRSTTQGLFKADATKPTVTTTAVSSVGQTTANSGGEISSDGGASITARGVCWNTSTSPTISNSKTSNGTGTGSFASSITGLVPGTTYYVRAYATNGIGTAYGDVVSFAAASASPNATTSAANPVSSGSATLNGTVNPNDASTTVVFEYGITTNYDSTVTATQSPLTGTSSQSVSAGITGLNANATYHFRVKAENSAGKTYGNDLSFTTASVAPTVTTGTATPVDSESATLNGTVNPNGLSTTYYFEYGATSSFGSTTGLISAGSGWTDVSFAATIAALSPNTTYYYRLVATNNAGTSNGVNKSFTTQPAVPIPPDVVTGWATEISGNSAKLNGTVNPNGANTTYYFEYGTTTSYGSTTTSTNAGAGTNDVSVSTSLSGLSTNTTYHYRLVASNSGGTAYGIDQSFTAGAISKVIIVSGGGPYAGNNIWTSVEMISGYAFRALLYQGYTKDTIYYLSPNTSYDVDGDGKPDVDAAATSANLENAIKSWAQDATQLFLYLIGHGGTGTYRINVSEVLSAENLDTWLDDAQNSVIKQAIVLYDSCRSGSFLPLLIPPSGKQRILATSASSNENTLFSVRGTLSFSYLFWSHMFNGDSFYDCFVYGKDSVAMAYPNRMTPLIEGNGNGIGNEKGDKTLAQAVELGLGIQSGSDLPSVGSVSSPDTVSVGRSAVISATGVVALNGVSRVWAVVTPPGYSISPDEPVTDLPTVDLSLGNGRYEGTYSGFSTEGTYNIVVFVEDNEGFLSLPAQTTIVSTSLSACPECSVTPAVLTNVTFSSDCECSDGTSITIGTGVTIKSGANVIFKAPTVRIQSGFKAESGATVSIKQQ